MSRAGRQATSMTGSMWHCSSMKVSATGFPSCPHPEPRPSRHAMQAAKVRLLCPIFRSLCAMRRSVDKSGLVVWGMPATPPARHEHHGIAAASRTPGAQQQGGTMILWQVLQETGRRGHRPGFYGG